METREAPPGIKRLLAVEGNRQRLDGGAMFGNAPKTMWQRWIAPDENNRIELASRALYIETQAGTKILVEAGIGAFFSPKLKERYGVLQPEHMLKQNLAKHGLSPGDIDILVLSHLHFDHAGGILSAYQEGTEPHLIFDKAQFLVGRKQWHRAQNPHYRDRASYFDEIRRNLEQSGRLRLMDGNEDVTSEDLPLYFTLSHGHTPGMLISHIPLGQGQKELVFCADLIPGAPWTHLPITMGYDRYPEELINEKEALLQDLLPRQGFLFFTHDPNIAAAELVQDERGRYAAHEIALEDLARQQ
jgi:glyoxylase-like metal-dependent hydrolase (beta-lactamase superfamily II)